MINFVAMISVSPPLLAVYFMDFVREGIVVQSKFKHHTRCCVA